MRITFSNYYHSTFSRDDLFALDTPEAFFTAAIFHRDRDIMATRIQSFLQLLASSTNFDAIIAATLRNQLRLKRPVQLPVSVYMAAVHDAAQGIDPSMSPEISPLWYATWLQLGVASGLVTVPPGRRMFVRDLLGEPVSSGPHLASYARFSLVRSLCAGIPKGLGSKGVGEQDLVPLIKYATSFRQYMIVGLGELASHTFYLNHLFRSFSHWIHNGGHVEVDLPIFHGMVTTWDYFDLAASVTLSGSYVAYQHHPEMLTKIHRELETSLGANPYVARSSFTDALQPWSVRRIYRHGERLPSLTLLESAHSSIKPPVLYDRVDPSSTEITLFQNKSFGDPAALLTPLLDVPTLWDISEAFTVFPDMPLAYRPLPHEYPYGVEAVNPFVLALGISTETLLTSNWDQQPWYTQLAAIRRIVDVDTMHRIGGGEVTPGRLPSEGESGTYTHPDPHEREDGYVGYTGMYSEYAQMMRHYFTVPGVLPDRWRSLVTEIQGFGLTANPYTVLMLCDEKKLPKGVLPPHQTLLEQFPENGRLHLLSPDAGDSLYQASLLEHISPNIVDTVTGQPGTGSGHLSVARLLGTEGATLTRIGFDLAELNRRIESLFFFRNSLILARRLLAYSEDPSIGQRFHVRGFMYQDPEIGATPMIPFSAFGQNPNTISNRASEFIRHIILMASPSIINWVFTPQLDTLTHLTAVHRGVQYTNPRSLVEAQNNLDSRWNMLMSILTWVFRAGTQGGANPPHQMWHQGLWNTIREEVIDSDYVLPTLLSRIVRRGE